MWWAALALCEVLESDRDGAGAAGKRLLGRLDRYLSLLEQAPDGEPAPEARALLRTLLLRAGSARTDGPACARVREAFDLERALAPGTLEPDARSEALARARGDLAAAVQWLLRGDAAQRVIAAWHFGWPDAHEASGTHWLAPHLAHLLEDPYGVVRYVAARSLRTLPGAERLDFDYLGYTKKNLDRFENAYEAFRQMS